MRCLQRGVTGMLALMVAACGGGGGGSGNSDGGAGGGAGEGGGGVVTTSGLVPAAPALGLIITADAAALRPIQDGAVWTYRGVHTAYTGAAPLSYSTRTTQAATSSTAANESFSNSANDGLDTQPIAITGGIVGMQVSLNFTGKGAPETVQFIELRSPVREGDQYTMLDRHYTDTAIDADGDNKPDALDVALYGRVVGTEALSLPGLPTLSTVHVDVTLRTRVTYSSTGQKSPVADAVIQIWYARGIGIVRQRSSGPTASGNDVDVTDEQLTSWDGVTTGFGAMASRPAVVPLTSDVLPGQSLPSGQAIRGSAVFSDHALVVTAGPFDAGSTIARMDTLGRVVSAHVYPNLPAGQSGLLLPHAEGLLYLRQGLTASNTLKSEVELTRFDADGALTGGIGDTTIDLKGPRIGPMMQSLKAAVDGTTLWLLWPRIYNTPTSQQRELVLRPYTLNGTALGPELIVDARDSTAQHIVGVGGRVLLTWGRFGSGYEAVYASVALGDTSVTVRPFVSGMPTTTVTEGQLLVPSAGGVQGTLLWTTPLPDTPPGTTAGVVLDANQAPLRAGSTLGSEVLAGVPKLGPIASGIGTTPDRTLLVLSQDTTVNWLAPSATTPLSSTPMFQVRLTDTIVNQHLVFADRVVVLGGDSTQLRTTVVWLNGGAAP